MTKYFNYDVLMCRPTYYGINYQINKWMDINNGANTSVTLRQWQNLHHLIIKCGGFVEYVDPQPDLPDMVFTANAALIKDKKAVVSSFSCPERQPEEKYFKEWLDGRYETMQVMDYFFEGAGDALFAGNTLFAGFGFRSTRIAYNAIAEFLGIKDLVYCELVDGHFYHLDTCFCPLNAETAIFFPDAFTEDSVRQIRQKINAIAIPNHEALRFACNAVVLGNNVIIPDGCFVTEEILRQLGFNVYNCDVSELIKAGGACRCAHLVL